MQLLSFRCVEHAPENTASRPLPTLSVTDDPIVNDADPLEPDGTVRPAGLLVTRTPLRPLTIRVRAAVCAGGGGGGGAEAGSTVSVAVRVVPLYPAKIVTGVDAVTGVVEMEKTAAVDPAGTVTLDGTAAVAWLLLDSATTPPPEGAAAVSITTPCRLDPPVMDDWPSTSDCRPTTGPAEDVTASAAVRVVPL